MGCSSSVATVPLDSITIAIVGLDNSGKTCLLRSLAGDFNFDTVPNIGMGQEEFMYDDVKLTMYDLGGNGRFRSVWKRFYAEVWGFIFVVDASDKERFDEARETLSEMLKAPMLKDKPFVVVANKQDIEGAVKGEDLATILELPKKTKVYNAVVTDIKDNKANEGVSSALSSLVTDIIANFAKLYQKREKDMMEQEEIERKEKEEKMARLEKQKREREKEE